MKVGVYLFSEAITVQEAVEEADGKNQDDLYKPTFRESLEHKCVMLFVIE